MAENRPVSVCSWNGPRFCSTTRTLSTTSTVIIVRTMEGLGRYAILARRYVHGSLRAGARERLRAVIRERRPLLIAINHLSESDPYTVAAAPGVANYVR